MFRPSKNESDVTFLITYGSIEAKAKAKITFTFTFARFEYSLTYTVCSQKRSIRIHIKFLLPEIYFTTQNHPDQFAFLSHLEHPSGCSDGTSDGLAGYEEIQACKGKWIGHVKRGTQIVIIVKKVPYFQPTLRVYLQMN